MSKAEADVASTTSALEQLYSETEGLENAITEAQAKLDQAKLDKEKADNALKEAEAAKASADSAVEEAQTKVNEAKELVEYYLSQGSLGFFVYMNDETAVSVFDNLNDILAAHLQLGADPDATSIKNLQTAIDWIKQCNALRAEAQVDPVSGKPLVELKVDLYLLAAAQVQLNYGAINKGHSSNVGANVPDSGGENLAYINTGLNPFEQWYTTEKKMFEDAMTTGQYQDWDGVTQTVDLEKLKEAKTTHDIYVIDPNFFHEVGHYLNIVNGQTEYTGFAVTQYGPDTLYPGYTWNCYGQTFKSSSKGTVLSVEEFEQAVNEYVQSISADNLVGQAQEKLNEALATQALALEDWGKKNSAACEAAGLVESSEREHTAATEALSTHMLKIAQAEQAAIDAEKDLESCTIELQEVEDNVAIKEESLKNAQGVYETKSQAAFDAAAVMEQAYQNQTSKQQAYDDAVEELEAIKDAIAAQKEPLRVQFAHILLSASSFQTDASNLLEEIEQAKETLNQA